MTTQSSESASQDGDVFKNSTLQVEPLGLRYKDCVSLLKIQDAILSCER